MVWVWLWIRWWTCQGVLVVRWVLFGFWRWCFDGRTTWKLWILVRRGIVIHYSLIRPWDGLCSDFTLMWFGGYVCLAGFTYLSYRRC